MSNKKDSLGDRMKRYEAVSKTYLLRRCPVVLRLDGKAFHSFTRKHCAKGFDDDMRLSMTATAERLIKEIQGAKIAYTQSDEITVVVTDLDSIVTDAWFKYNAQKMCSIAASIATLAFNDEFASRKGLESSPGAMFDCRAFNVPFDDVENCLVWRQQDWERNSVQMLARSMFSHKECTDKNCPALKEMCAEAGHVWDDLPFWWKYGTTVLPARGTESVRALPHIIYNSPRGREIVQERMNGEETE